MPVATALAVLAEFGHTVATVSGAEAAAAGHDTDKLYVVDGTYYDLAEVRDLAEERCKAYAHSHGLTFRRIREIKGHQVLICGHRFSRRLLGIR